MKTRRAQSARRAPVLLAALALVSSLLLTSCGGGGGGGGSTPPVPTAPLTITTDALPQGMAQQYYSSALSVKGGTPPYEWSLTPGSDLPPAGLAFTTLGYLVGTPMAAGNFNLTVQVQDHASRSATKTLPLKILEPLRVSPNYLPPAMMGVPYSQTLQVTGGRPPYTWTLVSGSLQAGLSLSTDGVISGTPTESRYDNYLGIHVQDADSWSTDSWVSLTVVGILEIATTTLPAGNILTPYRQVISFLGGLSPYEVSMAPGSAPLPPGLTLTGLYWGGQIEGTPTTPGTYTFTLQVKDSGPVIQTATGQLTLVIENHLYFPTYSELPLGVVAQPYAEMLSAGGGTPPYSWSITSGSLSAGLTLNPSSGAIGGTPTEAGAIYIGVRVTDSGSPAESAEGTVYFIIRPELIIRDEGLFDGTRGDGYWSAIYVDGGRPPISLRITSGSLPPGISLSGADTYTAVFPMSGIPTALGTFPFSVEVTDSSSPPGVRTRDFSIRVSEPLVFDTTSLPEGMTGTPFHATLTAHGGVPPYTWTLDRNPPLPNGLTLDPTSGEISGTPTQAWHRGLYITVKDSSFPEQTAYRYLDLRILERLIIATSRIPSVRPYTAFTMKLGASGGMPPYSWSLTSGALPDGLTFSPSAATISGTPTAEGSSNFTVQVTDTGPPVQTASKALSLTISNSLGRNDSPPTATPISNGAFRASISPYSDPVDGPAFPDSDYYELTANPGAVVTVETKADRLSASNPLDSVIEIVDAAGNRFNTCRPGNDTYSAYNQACLNDDFDSYNTLDSKLQFQVPGTGTDPVTFYVHVLSWDGGARPDYIYELDVSGAN